MLFRKAFRAMWANKKSYLACIFLITLGIMLYAGMNTAVDSLEESAEKFYSQYNLADVFATVAAMPVSALQQLYDVDGVEMVEARYVYQARVPIGDQNKTLRLISIDMQQLPRLNDILIKGQPLDQNNSIIVNGQFLEANNLIVGDSIPILANGRENLFEVCGTAISPEYVYISKGGADILPDEGGFGIAYITWEGMAALNNSPGVANQVILKLKKGYHFDNVKVALEDALAPYGVEQLIDKEDQLSYVFLESELDSLRSTASALPVLFMFLSLVVLYLMMKRMIEQDRTQIGTLKAFGYSSVQIVLHYLSYGAVTGILGGVSGWFCGYFLSGAYFQMFLQYFQLPGTPTAFNMLYTVNSLVIALSTGLLGTGMSALKILRMNPSEAMRPESPKAVKGGVGGFGKMLGLVLSTGGQMAVRSITRSPARSVFVIIGVTFSFALLSVIGSFDNIMDKMIFSQFTDIMLYNVKITLKNPLNYQVALQAAYHIEHVYEAEGLLEMPVVLKNNHIKESAVITGIPYDSALYKVCDTNTKEVYPPPRGSVIVSNGLADKLKVEAGDRLYLQSSLADDDISLYVERVIEQNLGSGCYIELASLSELLGLNETATSIMLNTTDPDYLKDYLKNSENTYAIDHKDDTLIKYQNMMSMYTGMYFIMEVMGALIAFAIIYNTSTISLSERKREYATLRVLGLSVREVCGIMSFEYRLLGVISMILGVPFALFINNAMNSMMDTSLYSMPSTLPIGAYLTGAVGCILAVELSGLSAFGKIAKLDMVEVLKERE